jgi:putative ABC transport system permease protein
MFFNYVKTAFRNIIKHKGYSLLNIAGLAIGLGIFSLVVAFVEFHFSFDRFHKNADRTHLVVQVLTSGPSDERHTASTPLPLRTRLTQAFPEIEASTRWLRLGRRVVHIDSRKFFQEEGTIAFADPNFLSFFTFEMIAGDPAIALLEPKSAVLTESTARKYFGPESAMGQKLRIGSNLEVVVKGVTRDIPPNSSLTYDMLLSLTSYDLESNWRILCGTFVRLSENIEHSGLIPERKDFIETLFSDAPTMPQSINLLPLTDLHLKAEQVRGFWRTEPRLAVLMTLVIGLVLILVVCFNFTHMAMAQYLIRAKEIAVRKVVGASRYQLMLQFLGESITLAVIAFPIAIVVNEMMIPIFKYGLGEKVWSVNPGLWMNPVLTAKLFAITVLIGVLAGSYPAFFLSHLKPVQIFKKNLPTGKRGGLLRKILVVSQFVTAIFSVLVSLLTFEQYHFLLNMNLGINKEKVLAVPLGTKYGRYQLQALKADLLRHPDIRHVSSAVWIPSEWNSERHVIPVGMEDNKPWTMNAYGMDYDFIELMQMHIVKGRAFSRKHTDRGKYIINETAARKLNWPDPIGKTLTIRGQTGPIIGVVKDFHFKSLFQGIIPSVLYLEPNYLNYLFIKLSGACTPRLLNFVENRWRQFSLDLPFEHFLLNQRIEINLMGLKRWAMLAAFVGIITLIFSCLGLLGLTSYATQQRTKEIGIRKAHGATTGEIALQFLIESLKLLIIACVISMSLLYLIKSRLIGSIAAYEANTGFSIFILACLLSLFMGMSAVIYHTVKAARANPVEALRYE